MSFFKKHLGNKFNRFEENVTNLNILSFIYYAIDEWNL